MNLIANCDSCKAEIPIKSSASTRPELGMEKGDEFNINCTKCGKDTKKHVNDVRAISSNTILIGGSIISLLLAAALWYFLGLIGVIALAIPLFLWRQQTQSAHAFNLYRTRR